MTPEDTSPARYLTLRDYLSVLRRYGLLIVLIGIVGAAAGLADALRQTSVYEATSEVAFQDPAADQGLVGLGTAAPLAPAQVAAQNADTATGPAIMKEVQRKLRVTETPQALGGAISTQVSVASGLLQITASSSHPDFAARLANVAAEVLVARVNTRTQAQFARLGQSLQRRITRLAAVHSNSPAVAGQLAFYADELARLRALGTITHAAQVVRPAQPPSSAVSPHPARSTLIGLALGLLLGLLVAFFRDALDRRLRSGRDMETLLDLPILGHVRKRTLGHVPQIHNGSNPRDRVDVENFRILRRNLDLLSSESRARSIAVTSALPEEGKTTVAASLAVSLASAGRRTLLVDCDLRRSALAERLRVAPTPGLSDYLLGEAGPRDVLRDVSFGDLPGESSANGGDPSSAHQRLTFIPAGSRTPRAAELLGSARFKEFLAQVSATYDVVVLDTSPLLPVADTLEILSHVEAVLLCARESRTTKDEAIAVRATLNRFPDCRAGLVVTGVTPHSEPYSAEVYGYA